MLCWAVSPLLIRYVRDWFSVSFQNFYRFGVSILILWIFTLASLGPAGVIDAVRPVRRPFPKFLVIALCNFAHQFFLIRGVYLLFPGLVTIVEESTIVFAVLLAFLFIPEERRLIKSPIFITGLVMAVAGVGLTAVPELIAGGAESGGAVAGIIFILISSLAWALFSLLVRLWLPETPSAVTSSIVFSLVIPFFLIAMIFESGEILPSGAPPEAWLLLTLSGLLGIGIAYPCYYKALKGLGVTMTSVLGLLIPVITAALSFVVFGEVLSLLQLAGTAVLLTGCLIIMRTRFSL